MNNILHLRYAVEIEKTGSISKAAENLFMGQPHLSKAIRELEASLGIVIFKRSSKGVAPTEKGREFLSYAKSIIAQMDELEARYGKGNGGSEAFEIAVPRASYFSYVFREFLKRPDFPKNVSVDWHETDAVGAMNSVSDGEVSIAVIRYQSEYEEYFKNYIDDKGLKARELRSSHYRLIASVNSKLAGLASVSSDALEDQTELVHGDFLIPTFSAAKMRRLTESASSKRRISVYERASQLEVLSDIHDTYMWVSPLPKTTLERYSLTEIPYSGSSSLFKDVLVYREGYSLNDAERLFLNMLDEYLKTSREQNSNG